MPLQWAGWGSPSLRCLRRGQDAAGGGCTGGRLDCRLPDRLGAESDNLGSKAQAHGTQGRGARPEAFSLPPPALEAGGQFPRAAFRWVPGPWSKLSRASCRRAVAGPTREAGAASGLGRPRAAKPRSAPGREIKCPPGKALFAFVVCLRCRPSLSLRLQPSRDSGIGKNLNQVSVELLRPFCIA